MSAAQDEYDELFRDKGKRTQHPEDDNDDAASFLESDSDNDDHENTPHASDTDLPSNGSGRPRHQIPYQRNNSGTTNTGPKGVIADAQDYRDAQRSQRASMAASRTSLHSQATYSGTGATQIPQLDLHEEGDESDKDHDFGARVCGA